jgi:Protein of unknown function (DUF4240)
MSERSLVGAALAIAGAALGAVLVLALHQRSEAPRLVVQTVPNDTSAGPRTVTAVAPPPAVRAAAPARRSPAPRPSRPEALFWTLVEQTRRAGDKDTGRQSGLLKNRLTELSPKAILQFENTRQQLDRRAYTWKMLGAASVIEDGCSDDCFRDFRAYVISLGRDAYERALRNPDSLAAVAQDAEAGDWENADDVAPDAYSSVTGNDFPYDVPELSGKPAGKPISLGEASLSRRYPHLAARFRAAGQ